MGELAQHADRHHYTLQSSDNGVLVMEERQRNHADGAFGTAGRLRLLD